MKERKQRKDKGGKNTEKRERSFLWTPGENVFLLENIVRGQNTVEEYEKVVSSRPEGAKYYKVLFDNTISYIYTFLNYFTIVLSFCLTLLNVVLRYI